MSILPHIKVKLAKPPKKGQYPPCWRIMNVPKRYAKVGCGSDQETRGQLWCIMVLRLA